MGKLTRNKSDLNVSIRIKTFEETAREKNLIGLRLVNFDNKVIPGKGESTFDSYYFEVSAKSNNHIEESLNEAILSHVKKHQSVSTQLEDNVDLDFNNFKFKKKSGCC